MDLVDSSGSSLPVYGAGLINGESGERHRRISNVSYPNMVVFQVCQGFAAALQVERRASGRNNSFQHRRGCLCLVTPSPV